MLIFVHIGRDLLEYTCYMHLQNLPSMLGQINHSALRHNVLECGKDGGPDKARKYVCK